LALASNADFLTTGNTKDFILNEYKNTKILTPREYWDVYAPK
jgi:predicted nucleic acid-binding protein